MDDKRKKRRCIGRVLLVPVMLAYVSSSVLVLRADQEYGLHTSVQIDTTQFEYPTTQILRHFLVEIPLIDSPESPDFLLKAGLYPCALQWPTREVAIRGDVTGNGIINIRDVLATVKHIINTRILEGRKRNCADCNSDGEIDIQDILGMVNVILDDSQRYKTGICKPEVSYQTLVFLESLEPYLRVEDFARLMALVQSEVDPKEERDDKLITDLKQSDDRQAVYGFHSSRLSVDGPKDSGLFRSGQWSATKRTMLMR